MKVPQNNWIRKCFVKKKKMLLKCLKTLSSSSQNIMILYLFHFVSIWDSEINGFGSAVWFIGRKISEVSESYCSKGLIVKSHYRVWANAHVISV